MEQLAAIEAAKENSRACCKGPQPQQDLSSPLAQSCNRVMPAYIIVEIEILDPAGYEEYKKLAGASVEKYGGKYIVRGGKTEVLEGDWQPKRIVVLEFESMQRAKEWLNCEEYREPRKMRHRTARTNMLLVEGM